MPRKRNSNIPKEESTAERVLTWLKEYIDSNNLTPGDSLPGELEIAAEIGVGRSSVREALTALRVLGIITTRRKGGIRIVRDPVILRLRAYLSDNYSDATQQLHAMEFRAVMEWGLAELVFAQINSITVNRLNEIVNAVRENYNHFPDLIEAEKMFHTVLTKASGNRLAELMSFIIEPIFNTTKDVKGLENANTYTLEQWLHEHGEIVHSLQCRDQYRFLAAMKAHTHSYMRLSK